MFSFCASLTLCFFNTTFPLPDHTPGRFPWLLLSPYFGKPLPKQSTSPVLLFLKLSVQLFQSSPVMFLLFDIVLPRAVVSQEHSDCDMGTSKDDAHEASHLAAVKEGRTVTIPNTEFQDVASQYIASNGVSCKSEIQDRGSNQIVSDSKTLRCQPTKR